MDRVKLNVLGLSYGMATKAGAYALILSNEEDTYRLPIVIAMPEAQSIAIQMEHIQTQRPMTHDLMQQLMNQLGATVKEVFIARWEAGIYYADLLVKTETEEIHLDARTSDAVALALRFGCPIYAAQSVMEMMAVAVTKHGIPEEMPLEEEIVEPVQEFTIQELQQLMEKAVENEDYESASRYRDMLKAKNVK